MENEKQEVIFIDGMGFYERSSQQPEWILGKISVNLNKFIPFLHKHADERGWLNIDMKKSKKGETYFQLNNWKPTARTAEQIEDKKFEQAVASDPDPIEYQNEEINLEDIPF